MAMEVPIHDRMVKNETLWNYQEKVNFVDEWFLMGSPMPLILILVGYWSFVLKLGPEYMKNKPAFNVNRVLAFYNILQITYSCYLSFIGTKLLITNGLIPSACIMEGEANRFIITSGIYSYLFAKLTELFDTVFFVLKKNYRQVSFLHVYHHSIIIVCTWGTLKYEPSYNTVFIGTLNSYVHIVMYTYYYLSAFPELAPYLWWKKYITKMQIIQFIIMIIQAGATYCFSGCPPSHTLLAAIFLNALLFTGLFINFYVDSYKKTKKIA